MKLFPSSAMVHDLTQNKDEVLFPCCEVVLRSYNRRLNDVD